MASRRKHVAQDLDDVQLGEGCMIARVLEARGGNQMEVCPCNSALLGEQRRRCKQRCERHGPMYAFHRWREFR